MLNAKKTSIGPTASNIDCHTVTYTSLLQEVILPTYALGRTGSSKLR